MKIIMLKMNLFCAIMSNRKNYDIFYKYVFYNIEIKYKRNGIINVTEEKKGCNYL